MTLAILTVLAATALAFANGANDVSKGVATLAGTGRTSYRTAIAWGSFWTFAGGIASLVVSVGLAKAFTSAIVGPDVLAASFFPLAVAGGAAGWVLIASVTGLPVSTTHALAGAIVGAALTTADHASVHWGVLLSGIAAPLALSPLVSAGIGYGMQAIAVRLSPACVCLEDELTPLAVDRGGAALAAPFPRLVRSTAGCAPAEGRRRLMPGHVLHWGAAAALSFARGLNDNPKIAAIGVLGFPAFGADLWLAFGTTAVAMTAGSYIAGRRVTETLGERVVHMQEDTGLAGAVVAAGLVLAASFYTLPVSTTHVSTGAIVGAGLRQGRGAVEWRNVRSLIAAWIVTLPVAAALGGLATLLGRMVA